MKQLTLLVLLAISLFAGASRGAAKAQAIMNGTYFGNNQNSYNSRGLEQPGDTNWNNVQQDKYLYGDDNAYQGSRAGDDDWGKRNLNHLMGQ